MIKAPGAAPIIVITPDLEGAQSIAGWLRGAGLRAISTVRTSDEAIFMLGRGSPGLLILDEKISGRAEGRLLRHLRAFNGLPPLVRMIAEGTANPLAAG